MLAYPLHTVLAMTSRELVELLAAGGRNAPQAADELDRTVERILSRLRQGQAVALPGLGRLVPDRNASFRFEKASVLRGVSRVKR